MVFLQAEAHLTWFSLHSHRQSSCHTPCCHPSHTLTYAGATTVSGATAGFPQIGAHLTGASLHRAGTAQANVMPYLMHLFPMHLFFMHLFLMHSCLMYFACAGTTSGSNATAGFSQEDAHLTWSSLHRAGTAQHRLWGLPQTYPAEAGPMQQAGADNQDPALGQVYV